MALTMTTASGGAALRAAMELKDKTGRLVYAESTDTRASGSRLWERYDVWRCVWCSRHRRKWTPPGFRAGTRRWLVFALAHPSFYRINSYR